MNRGLLLAPGVAVLLACGTPPATQPAVQSPHAPASTQPVSAEPELPALLIEYVVIHRRWVEKLVPTTPADVKAWSESPENASVGGGAFRQILVKAGDKDAIAAKKKAQSILQRLDKGEDFTKLAKQLSDDAASKDNGGEVPPENLKDLPPEVTTAFASLVPGKTTSDPIRAADGFHIVHKDRLSDDALERAYRKAKAPELAVKLADEILAHLKGDTTARTVIADATDAVLGERAKSDAARPNAQAIPRANVANIHLSAAAKAALVTFAKSAHAGDVLPSPAVDGETIVVARARAPGADGSP